MKTTTLFRSIVAAVAILTFCSTSLWAQVKIGTTPGTPDPSAMLEVQSANKGFLPPRVSLQSRTDQTTVPSPATGLMVYHTGSAGLGDAGIYVWNGSSWISLKSDGSAASVSDLKIGETRTGLVVVPASTFFNGQGVTGTNKTWMNSANTTTSVAAKLLSEAKGSTSSFPTFAGMRMDFSSWGYENIIYPAPKLVNTTNIPVTYSISSLSTNDALKLGVKHTMEPGAVCWKVDGNDGFLLTQNRENEYVNCMITIHKGSGVHEFYMATWSLMWVDTEIIGIMTVTRYN